MALGKRLKEAREFRKLTKTALSVMVDMTDAGIGAIENRDQESARKSLELAEALQISHAWLIRGEGSMLDGFEKTNGIKSDIKIYLKTTVNDDVGQPVHISGIDIALIKISGTIEMRKEDGFKVEVFRVEPTHQVPVFYATQTTSVFQIVGSGMQRPLRDGWHIACDQSANPIQGEYLLIQHIDDSWSIGEYLYGQDTSIEVDSLEGSGRRSILRNTIKILLPVIGIIPPSQRQPINSP